MELNRWEIGICVFVIFALGFVMGSVFGKITTRYDDPERLQRLLQIQELSYHTCDDYGCSKSTKELHWELVMRTYWYRKSLEKIQELHPPKKENENKRIRNNKDTEEH